MTTSFGPYSNNNLRLSPYGIAIKNKAGKWVSYNKQTERLLDVDIFNIEIDTSKIFYRIPKALNDIEPGNLIIHNGELVFVERIENSRLVVINPSAGTEMTVLPTASPFGYDYVDAIISLADYFPEADSENPWGNLLPFMMMGKDNSAIALMLALGGDMSDIDPMMLLAASGDNAFLMLTLMNRVQTKRKYENKKAEELARKIELGRKRAASLNKEDIDE
jgi:hypothetical protein